VTFVAERGILLVVDTVTFFGVYTFTSPHGGILENQKYEN
jgi:hypothetical protein